MTSASEFVRHGWRAYSDYDRSSIARLQWLVSDKAADILSNALAVFLAVAAKATFTIAKRFILFVDKKTPDTIAPEVLGAVRESHSPEGLFWRLCKLLFGGVVAGLIELPVAGFIPQNRGFGFPSRESLGHTWDNFIDRLKGLPWALFIAFSMATLYIGLILGSIFSVLVVDNSVAVSNHPGCSMLVYNHSTDPYLTMRQKYFYDIESESGEYARRCYNRTNLADGCNYFYQPSIPFTVRHNDTCPFKSEFGPLCIGGTSGALTITTGRVRPEVIGINTKLKYTFIRQATCSPLITDDRFVRPFLMDNQRLYYRYFYGNTIPSTCSGGFSNCTFEIRAGVDSGFSASYSVSIRHANPLSNDQSWLPNFEVNIADGELATVFVVSNPGIKYPQKQMDPIFPAEATNDNQWYYNSRGHGGVLACLDHTYMCLPDAQCAPLAIWTNIQFSNDERSKVIKYLTWSLFTSNIGSAIDYRHAEGLDANSKLAIVSLPLDAEQWKVEVIQLFQTSLAKIQLYARNLARGSPNIPPWSINLLDKYPQIRGLCNLYKFKSTGWRNISVSEFLAAIGAGLVALFLGRTTGSEENEGELRVEEYYRALRDFAWKEFFTRCWHGVCYGFTTSLSWIKKWVGKGVRECRDKLNRLLESMKQSRAAARASRPRRWNGTNTTISDGISL